MKMNDNKRYTSRQALNILKNNYHCKRDVELFKIIERDLDRLKDRDNTIKYAVKKLKGMVRK